jgi:hypothetical protein
MTWQARPMRTHSSELIDRSVHRTVAANGFAIKKNVTGNLSREFERLAELSLLLQQRNRRELTITAATTAYLLHKR